MGTFGTSPSSKRSVPVQTLKGNAVKNIALTLVAVATLGLAACSGGTEANNTAGNEIETTNEANEDVGNAIDAENAAGDALNAVVNTGADAVNATSNAASTVGNAVEGAVDGASNATSNSAR
jgi:hypothetical protein